MATDNIYHRLSPITWMTLVTEPHANNIKKIVFEFWDTTSWSINIEDGKLIVKPQNVREQQESSSADNAEGYVFHNIRGTMPGFERDEVRMLFLDLMTKNKQVPGYDAIQWDKLRRILNESGYDL